MDFNKNSKKIPDLLKVVSSEKTGESKVYSIHGYYCGTVAKGIFFFSQFNPHLVVNKFLRHLDAKDRHGDQNCFKRCQLLLIELVETVLKISD